MPPPGKEVMMVGARKMLLKPIAVVCFILGVTTNAWATPPEGVQKMTSTQELIKQFTEFRLEFARQPGYTGMWESDEEREAVMKALREDRTGDFMSLSGPWLEECPVDAPIHWVRALRLEGSGDALGAVYHRMMFYGLLMSIIASGDGIAETSAYKVISIAEEYNLLDFLGVELKQQSLRGHCDVIKVERDGVIDTVYFDVSISLDAMNKEFGGGTKKP